MNTEPDDEDYLIKLIIDYKRRGGIFTYNAVRFQQYNTSPCARQCVSRLRHKEMTHKQYEMYLKYKNLTPDELVILMTNDI